MADPHGPQYLADTPFKAAARLHQSKFRSEQLGVHEWRDYGNRLPAWAALQGLNFYPWPGLLEMVEARFGMGDKKLTVDMLASDHLPFNFFSPLVAETEETKALIAHLAGEPVTAVGSVKVEWSPKPRSVFLDDHTAFDVYIEYRRADGRLAALGIELKYTEGAYGWGKTERKRMADPQSLYRQAHRLSGLYRPGSEGALATKTLKQFWRNQLLGERLVQGAHRGLDGFRSILIYPSGNGHFVDATDAYRSLIAADQQHRFSAVTFRELFDAFDAHLTSAAHKSWIAYLRSRYVHPQGSSTSSKAAVGAATG